MSRRMIWKGAIANLLVSFLWICPPAVATEEESRFRPFVDLVKQADAMVTVRFVVKVQMPGIDQEAESEVTCLSIDPEGLVLCSATELGGYFSVMARLMGRSDAPIRAVPTDLQVVVAEGTEYAADLMARDSERDLAWLMLRDLPSDVRLPYFDFSAHAEPEIGESVFLLRRMDPFFGSAPVVSEARIAAVIDQPRRLIVLSRPEGRMGMPAVAADGRILGLVVTQVPGSDDGQAVVNLRSRSLPGQPGPQDDMLAGVVLPAGDVVRATELARQVWAEDRAEALE
ncbi:MAG: hypothetical protein MPN21_23685 [Thermoanaerobaculia bacterium]|nr:hypothetical protein [Thermoanaerobaculia bacterium]